MAAVAFPDPLSSFIDAQAEKQLLRFVTIGSVDDGKSTLIGRLLHDAQGLYSDQLEAVRRASVKGATRTAGSASEIDFSLFTDGLLAEREQGITIDVAYRYFATSRRKFIIADTPGHVQYTRNMATGASTADAAVILIDARLGVIEQTHRHARIAALLGIPHVIACVNKMDLVEFAEARFVDIRSALEELRVDVGLVALEAIPISALAGDNVVADSTRMPWWTDGTLLSRLETLPVGRAEATGFRLPVQIVIRPGLSYRGFAGRIASGAIAVGDEVVALPSGRRTRVAGIDVGDRAVSQAAAPLSIALRLADEIDISRGDVIAHVDDLPVVTTELDAHVVWMAERRLDPARTYLVKHTTRMVRAMLEAPPLALNDIGRAKVHLRAPLYVDPYKRNRTTGAFIIIDPVSNDTVGAGMIDGARPEEREAGAVTTEERITRLGQRGIVVEVPEGEAIAIERALFDRDRIAAIVPRSAANAVADAGLIALVPSPTAQERPFEARIAEILVRSASEGRVSLF